MHSRHRFHSNDCEQLTEWQINHHGGKSVSSKSWWLLLVIYDITIAKTLYPGFVSRDSYKLSSWCLTDKVRNQCVCRLS